MSPEAIKLFGLVAIYGAMLFTLLKFSTTASIQRQTARYIPRPRFSRRCNRHLTAPREKITLVDNENCDLCQHRT